MTRITTQKPVKRGGTGARQPGDEDRADDLHTRVLRIALPRRLTQQPRYQRVAQEEPGHLATDLGQIGVVAIRIEKHGEGF